MPNRVYNFYHLKKNSYNLQKINVNFVCDSLDNCYKIQNTFRIAVKNRIMVLLWINVLIQQIHVGSI
jgi:hypothetical protein